MLYISTLKNGNVLEFWKNKKGTFGATLIDSKTQKAIITKLYTTEQAQKEDIKKYGGLNNEKIKL